MNYLSLFSGACGGDLAFQHLLTDFKCVGYVEIDDYCQRVIRQRQKDGLLDEAPIFGCIKDFIHQGYAASYQGMVDLVTGGFPCQDISCAGKGAGIEGERSGLWGEMAEVVRQVRPKHVFVENSPMLTIRGLGTVLKDLAEMGFDARWGCVSSAETGNIHKRNRIWIISHTHGHGCKNETSKKQNKAVKNWEVFTRWWGKLPAKRLDRGICSIIDIERIYKSQINGNDDEISNQMDRLAATGNAQDPFVAATAWEILKP